MGYNSFTCPRMDTGTTISGPGEWGNAWMYDPDAGSSDSEPTPASGPGEFGNSWQYNNTLPGASEGWTPPKEIPAWENFLGGLFDQAMGGGTPGESFLRDTTGYGTSKFLCANVDAGMVWGYALSGCLGSMRTEGGFDLAWVGSEGPEMTTPGWTVSGTAGYSNADDWNQVRGSGLNLDGTFGLLTGGYSQAVNTTTNCMEDGSSLPITSVVRNGDDNPVGTFSFGVSTPGADVGGSLTCTGVH